MWIRSGQPTAEVTHEKYGGEIGEYHGGLQAVPPTANCACPLQGSAWAVGVVLVGWGEECLENWGLKGQKPPR